MITVRPLRHIPQVEEEPGVSVEQRAQINAHLLESFQGLFAQRKQLFLKKREQWAKYFPLALKACAPALASVVRPPEPDETADYLVGNELQNTFLEGLLQGNVALCRIATTEMIQQLKAAFSALLALLRAAITAFEQAAQKEVLEQRNRKHFHQFLHLPPLEYRPQQQTNAPNIAA